MNNEFRRPAYAIALADDEGNEQCAMINVQFSSEE